MKTPADTTPAAVPAPRRLAGRRADFTTLTAALDVAAAGESENGGTERQAAGMTFLGPRGAVVERLPYARLSAEAREAAARLLASGLAPGDRVGIVAETHGDFVRAFLGCLYARLVACPMPLPAAFGSRASYAAQIRRIADVADIAAVLMPAEFRDWIAEAIGDRPGLRLCAPLGELGEARAPLPGPPDGGSLAYLQFSSGTTSAPKGIAVTHGAMMANLSGMARALGIGPGDRGVSWLPFYHDMGLVGTMLLPVATGMPIDYLATRDFVRRPGLWLDMIAGARATVSYAPSFGYELAARRARPAEGLDLSSWRVAGIGGDMVRPSAAEEFARAFAPLGFRAESFRPSYGLAEATLAVTFPGEGSGIRTARPVEGGGEAVLCGRPLPGHGIDIRDGAGASLPEGRTGVIHVRGPSLMTGYFRDDAATDMALDADGWLDTGDVGFLSGGELAVTGRAKDLVIVNGRNVWPQDVEWEVEAKVPGVRSGDAAAFGLASAGGERVVVVVECRTRDAAARAALAGAVREAAAAIGLEVEVALAPPGSLPRTSSGKLSRARVRETFLAGGFDA